MNGNNGFSSVYVWSEKDGQVRRVTDPLFNAESPAWDPDGKYLFFASDREFAPQLSTVEFNFATNRTTGLFAVALRKDVPHLFPPESDEVKIADEKKDEPKADEKKPDETDEEARGGSRRERRTPRRRTRRRRCRCPRAASWSSTSTASPRG